MKTYEEVKKEIADAGQEQLLRWYGDLTEEEKASLLGQIESIDTTYLSAFAARGEETKRGVISPIRAMSIEERSKREDIFREKGVKAIREGRLGLVLLAGGMGTRLGSKDPKGMYDIGKTRHVYIFQRLIENILKIIHTTGAFSHLFIMTSEKNDIATRAFFKENGCFGYPADYVHFFRQEMAPVVDPDGEILLADKGVLATSPNGNGGWFTSLLKAGYGDLMEKEGIDYLNVFAVDNVLQNIGDPVFFGAVLDGGYPCGSKVVRKNSRDEKVGVMCLEDGRPSVIEYFEMTDAMLDEKNEAGLPAYAFGVILNYLFSVPALKKVMDEKMQVHFANKKVAYLDEKGTHVEPAEPNAWKFEYFILDQVHELTSCLPYEVERGKEFAPIKNLTGTDSVESARALCEENGIEL